MWPLSRKYTISGSGVLNRFTDHHCHILPGVDDGVRSTDEALEILALYESLGVRAVWLTPHIMEDMPNTTDRLAERFNEFKAAYKGPVELHLSAEYMLDGLFIERLSQGDLLPLGENGDKLLVETSYYSPPAGMRSMLELIRAKGFHPVLAHPERAMYMDDEDYVAMKKCGVQLQINIPSLTGLYGKQIKTKAKRLVTNGMADMYGSDTHSLLMARDFTSGRLDRRCRTAIMMHISDLRDIKFQ